MKTKYETEIGIEKKIIILTTKTVEFLLSKNPDSLALYLFYIKNSKIQKTNSIFSVESFGMKGLGWGRNRYRNAKKTLVDEKFIIDLIRRDKKGKIEGHYLKINYLFTEKKIDESLEQVSHPVGNTSGSKRETNALSNKTINALSNKKESISVTTDKPKVRKKSKKQLRLESPFSFKVELGLLGDSAWLPNKIMHNYFKTKSFKFTNYGQFDTEIAQSKIHAVKLQGYSSSQINKAMNYCRDEMNDLPWNLSTVVKIISNVVNK